MKNRDFALLFNFRNIEIPSFGGTEKYIINQVNSLRDINCSSIIVYPIVHDKADLWGIDIDREHIIVRDSKGLLDFLNDLSNKEYRLKAVFVHHLKNVNITNLQKIINCISDCPVLFYLHDFYSACTSDNFMKNDAYFCGDSVICKEKCSDCQYYSTTMAVREKTNSLLNSIAKDRLTIVAPSQIVKDLWGESFPQYKENIVIFDHLTYDLKKVDSKTALSEKEVLNVAFVGRDGLLKGHDAWKNATSKLETVSNNMNLYILGQSTHEYKNVAIKPVSTQTDGDDAMKNAIGDNNIHIAVLNTLCPETYCFTYFESYQNDVFIITNKNSGNIACQVRKNGNGFVMESSDDLAQVLSDEANLRNMYNSYITSVHAIPVGVEYNRKFIEYMDKSYTEWLQKYDVNHESVVRRFIYTVAYCIKNMKLKKIIKMDYKKII